VVGIVLGTQLRRLRKARGITVEVASHALGASHTKISRMEHGRVGFKAREVADLLTLYGVTDQHQRQTLLTLALQANAADWAHCYSDLLPSWGATYLGLEQASSVIRTYQPQVIPDLLQTEDVARALQRLRHPRDSVLDIERRVALQMTRQEILTDPSAPQLWAVIDQAALWWLAESSGTRPAGPASDHHGRVTTRQIAGAAYFFRRACGHQWPLDNPAVRRSRTARRRLPSATDHCTVSRQR
jgi:transcriptional regulator with XRE-family HTH domain